MLTAYSLGRCTIPFSATAVAHGTTPCLKKCRLFHNYNKPEQVLIICDTLYAEVPSFQIHALFPALPALPDSTPTTEYALLQSYPHA